MGFLRRLAGTGLATAATAVAGSLATDPDARWYRRLRKPPWQPPTIAFPTVWTALYADVAVTSAAVLHRLEQEDRHDEASAYRQALGLNLALNGTWSWLFWRARRPWLAAAECVVLTASSADLARRAGAAGRLPAATLAPYAAWCAFATALSIDIARRNPARV